MSATRPVLELAPPATPEPRRAPEREGHEEEFFPTPSEAIRAIAPLLATMPKGRWLEPMAGHGAIPNVLGRRPGVIWDLVELRGAARRPLEDLAARRRDVKILACPADYFARPIAEDRWQVAVTNPAFSLAERLLWRLRREAEHTHLLLRLAFLETVDRARAHRRDPPDVRVLAKRPSFTGEGTDSGAYAWFSWPGSGRLDFLLPDEVAAQVDLVDAGGTPVPNPEETR